MRDRIEIGDVVQVNFNGAQITLLNEATVLAKPCATGDSWIFKDLLTEAVLYISEGCTITKLSDGLDN